MEPLARCPIGQGIGSLGPWSWGPGRLALPSESASIPARQNWRLFLPRVGPLCLDLNGRHAGSGRRASEELLLGLTLHYVHPFPCLQGLLDRQSFPGLLFISTKLSHNNAVHLLHRLLRCWLNMTLLHLWRTGVGFLLEFPETSPLRISDDTETIAHPHSSPKNENCVIVGSTFFLL